MRSEVDEERERRVGERSVRERRTGSEGGSGGEADGQRSVGRGAPAPVQAGR
ncbi:hypothetical protein ACTHPH_19780 [Paenibacillus pasadenensis]|uniref:hypothetical protein n=1 Tax=Paenibacillus TaxID=44249 RepID=UPI0012EBB1E2|nr:hypothetical protein [Paenibacillus pasadenensis]